MLLRSARSLGLGVPSLRDPSGRIAYGLLRCTSSRCVWLRSHPRMNPSTQPSDVARGSRSRAAAELTLILLSGGKRMRSDVGFCGSWLASDGGLRADQSAVLTCRSCRRLRSFDLAFDCGKPKAKDRSLRQLLQGDVLCLRVCGVTRTFPQGFQVVRRTSAL